MKKIIFLLTLFILNNCSFDNKTGIWNNSNEDNLAEQNRFKDFETLYTEERTFNEIVNPKEDIKVLFNKRKKNLKWEDEYFSSSNNLPNFSLKNNNQLIYKSKKISKNNLNDKILFDGDNIIATDEKGNIIIFSTQNQNVTFKYNFYRKKYKKLSKKLFIKIDKEILFVADNIGYTYALDYKSKKLLWAHNYKIPFRSNIKIFEDKIILSDQNNSILILDKINGERLKILPTEETTIKNDFINSFALDEKSLFYLNTYGSLYSIDKMNFNINWLVNLNESVDLNNVNLFYSNPIIINKNIISVSTDPYLYIINADSGVTIFKLPITSIVNPVMTEKNLFLLTKDNLLVCLDLTKREINYSLNIDEEIAKFLDTKKKTVSVKNLFIVNDDVYLFLKNSYVVIFKGNGQLKEVSKMKEKILTSPIFINDSILYINNKKKLVILN